MKWSCFALCLQGRLDLPKDLSKKPFQNGNSQMKVKKHENANMGTNV